MTSLAREIRRDSRMMIAYYVGCVRPAAATAGAGAHLFDTTIGKPIRSDGAAWRDATGAAV